MTSRRDWQLQQRALPSGRCVALARCRGRLPLDPGTRPSGDGGKRSSRPDRSIVSDVLRALTVSPDQVLQLSQKKSRCCHKAVAATAGGWV